MFNVNGYFVLSHVLFLIAFIFKDTIIPMMISRLTSPSFPSSTPTVVKMLQPASSQRSGVKIEPFFTEDFKAIITHLGQKAGKFSGNDPDRKAQIIDLNLDASIDDFHKTISKLPDSVTLNRISLTNIEESEISPPVPGIEIGMRDETGKHSNLLSLIS